MTWRAVVHAKRHVRVEHTDDGMAWLQAYLPSHHAAAIENRLERLAKTHQGIDKAAGIKRSHAQRRADLLTHLVTSVPADHLPGTPGLRCDIAVTIDAAVLTGAVEGPAEATDGSWQVPADWVLESAFAGEAFWHRMLLDPITADVLAHEYAGRPTRGACPNHGAGEARLPGRDERQRVTERARGTSAPRHHLTIELTLDDAA